MIYLFVEGLDDQRFFQKAIMPYFKEKYGDVFIWTYSQKKKESIHSFIRTIRMMEGELLFVADKDEATEEEKRTKILESHPALQEHEVLIVVTEIESWYLSGLNEETTSIKLNRSIPRSTDVVTKEMFIDFFKNLTKSEAMVLILAEFDIRLAKQRNASFTNFLETVV